MAIHSPSSVDLAALAHQAMIEAGFQPDMPPEVLDEAQKLEQKPGPEPDPSVKDLRTTLWSSIDDLDTRDLDQIEYAERGPNGEIRVLIGLADVDVDVPIGSPIDRYAYGNATSVYTGVKTFPMLPEELSTNLTSLVDSADRLAAVIDLRLAPDGVVRSSDAYRAAVRNHARLDYESVGAWLSSRAQVPPEIARVPGLQEQLRLQIEACDHLSALRRQQGAIEVQTPEANPKTSNGRVVGMVTIEPNLAREIISNFMIAANIAIAERLQARGMPSIRRVVRTPARWQRIVELAESLGDHLPTEPDSRALADFLARHKAADPAHFPELSLTVVKLLGPGEYVVQQPGQPAEGHFGLATHDYTHGTAPNRRFADLAIQRLLKAMIAARPAPYAVTELQDIARQCNDRESAARKVERIVRKAAAAELLRSRIGETFEVIVTGAGPKGTWVRLNEMSVEGRVVRGEQGLDVGDQVKVRLVYTDPARGYIDFERVR